jgi:hypothetical protein
MSDPMLIVTSGTGWRCCVMPRKSPAMWRGLAATVGISRQLYYTWLRRYRTVRTVGLPGLVVL